MNILKLKETDKPFNFQVLPIAYFQKDDECVSGPPLPSYRKKCLGAFLSLGSGCVLRTNKQIYYLETQVLSESVASHLVWLSSGLWALLIWSVCLSLTFDVASGSQCHFNAYIIKDWKNNIINFEINLSPITLLIPELISISSFPQASNWLLVFDTQSTGVCISLPETHSRFI